MRSQPWLKCLDWAEVEAGGLRPPLVPDLQHPGDGGQVSWAGGQLPLGTGHASTVIYSSMTLLLLVCQKTGRNLDKNYQKQAVSELAPLDNKRPKPPPIPISDCPVLGP